MVKDIFLLGDRNPEFLTHRAFDAALAALPSDVRGRWVGTDSPEAARTSEADGIWVASGGPYRNDGAVLAAIESARTSGQPFLGTCSGFQFAIVEFSRNVAGIRDADHAETATNREHLVVDRLACSLVGQERMVTALAGTRLHAICGGEPFAGFHWCDFGLSPAYAEVLTAHGLVIAAVSDDVGVEGVELRDHPFFLATLFQPQMGSGAGRPLHPIITAFVASVGSARERLRFLREG
jgi:CTP synthase (UTP-ammonia lyase)